jgi:exoribonuclease-2
LRRVRNAQGALSLDTLEVRAVFDDGALSDLKPDARNRAKELIEDFMIAANGVTARYLEQKRMPSLRRVLAPPKRWDRIVALAAESGTRLPCGRTPRRSTLSSPIGASPTRIAFPDVSLAVVKLLGSGEYALEIPGSRRRDISVWRCATTRTRRRRTAGFPISSPNAC